MIVQHGPGRFPESKDIDQAPLSVAASLETPLQHGNVSGSTKLSQKKDPKSFTQRVFDAVPMRRLQLIKVPERFSEQQLGRHAANDFVSVEDIDDAIRTEERNSDGQSRCENLMQSELLPLEEKSDAAASQCLEVTLRRRGLDMKGFMPGPWHFVKNRFSAMFNMPDFALIDLGSQPTTGFGRNDRDAGFTQHFHAHGTQGSRSDIDEFFPTMPVAADSRLITSPQSLSRFTVENLEALSTSFEIFNPKIPDDQQILCSFGRPVSNFRHDSFVSVTTTQREREITFMSQSIIFVLGSLDLLLESFKDSNRGSENSKYGNEFLKIIRAFTPLFKLDCLKRCVFSSLWNSAKKLYPTKYYYSKNFRLSESLRSEALVSNIERGKSPTGEKALNDNEAMHIAKIALAALVACVPNGNEYRDAWVTFCEAHATGRAIYQKPHLELMDIFDDELCIELMTTLVKTMAARKYMPEITRHWEPQFATGENLPDSAENVISKLFHDVLYLSPFAGTTAAHFADRREISRYHAEILLQWLRSVILKSWDGKVLIQTRGIVGCALELISCLCVSSFLITFIDQYPLTFLSVQMSGPLGIDPSSFETPFFFTQLDIKRLPKEWLSSRKDRNIVHLLSFRFLFSREKLVSYFRAINHAAMLKMYNGSIAAEDLAETVDFAERGTHDGRFGTTTNRFLVLKLGRENILTDAINQLWRRGRHELMKPLKVYFDEHEGEEGVDQGGVQQEVMRVVISESMRPDYGNKSHGYLIS